MELVDPHSKFLQEKLREFSSYQSSWNLPRERWIVVNRFLEGILESLGKYDMSKVSEHTSINREFLKLLMRSIDSILFYTKNGIVSNGSPALATIFYFLSSVRLPIRLNFQEMFHNLFTYTGKFLCGLETLTPCVAGNLIHLIHHLAKLDKKQTLELMLKHRFRISSFVALFLDPLNYFTHRKCISALYSHLVDILTVCVEMEYFADNFLLYLKRHLRSIVVQKGYLQCKLPKIFHTMMHHHCLTYTEKTETYQKLILEIFIPLFLQNIDNVLEDVKNRKIVLKCFNCIRKPWTSILQQIMLLNQLLEIRQYSRVINDHFHIDLLQKSLELLRSDFLEQLHILPTSSRNLGIQVYRKLYNQLLCFQEPTYAAYVRKELHTMEMEELYNGQNTNSDLF
ncbi:hypothetical protein SNEBB_001471 [Seison nebaliae]|nr:hypothetical protein SNEBB_001471 [Seison nebaliae]